MIKIINETRLLELSRSLALDQIVTSVSKRPVSVKVNYPSATYNPVDHSFYQGGTLIGPAYVLVSRGYQKEYSGDIKDARLVSSGEVVSPKDLYKKIGSDANPSNRIPSP